MSLHRIHDREGGLHLLASLAGVRRVFGQGSTGPYVVTVDGLLACACENVSDALDAAAWIGREAVVSVGTKKLAHMPPPFVDSKARAS